MTDPITTTVTFQDLIDAYDTELGQLRDAYEETVAYAEEEYGENRAAWPDDLRQQARAYDEGAKAIQKRQHVLERFRDEWQGDRFEIKMLAGSELTAIETDLRMEAHREDVAPETLQAERKQQVADVACMDAPPEVPRDDSDSPTPSACPNPLTLAIYEAAERFNSSGATDFRAAGFGETTPSAPAGSERPTRSGNSSPNLDPTADATPEPGTDS